MAVFVEPTLRGTVMKNQLSQQISVLHILLIPTNASPPL